MDHAKHTAGGGGKETGPFGSAAKTTAGNPHAKGSKTPSYAGGSKHTSAKTDKGMKGH